MGTLYIVATPIGNLEDISFRAVSTLFNVSVIACEDTRRSGILMQELHKRFETFIPEVSTNFKKQQLVSYYEQNEQQKIPEIVNALINGLDVALISDAGTPMVSDPGFRLVREAIANKIQIISIPGPSSAISALVSSGLPPDKFLFLGYPPRKPGNRMKFFKSIKKSSEHVKATTILFEAPHKLVRTLEEIKEVFGDIEIVLARELTKVHEEIIRSSVCDILKRYEKHEPKGEFVILFNI